MALKSRSKVTVEFSASSMTDLVFLLLIFFMLTSTLVHPNALKLLLPQSNSQTSAKPLTAISINEKKEIFIETETGGLLPVHIDNLETILIKRIGNNKDIYISLHADKSLPLEEVVKVMNICKKNEYKLILATSPEKK